MLRRDRLIRMQIHQLMDAGIFAISFWLAYTVRANPSVVEWLGNKHVSSFDNYIWLYLVLIPAAPMVLEGQGFYNRPVLCTRHSIWWPLLKGTVLVTLGMILTVFLLKLETARGVIVGFGIVSFILVWIKEEIVRAVMRSKFAREQLGRRFILVGNREETAKIRADMDRRLPGEIIVVAEVDMASTTVSQLVTLVHEHSVRGVILSTRHANFEEVEEAIHACEIEGVEVWLIANFFKTRISKTNFDELCGRPVLVFSTVPDASWQGVVKTLMDLTLAGAMLMLISPFLIAIALLVKFTSPGPILFRQKRSGINGRPFTIYKFRTMCTNAEQMKHELEAMNEMTGPVFKVTNDPRITKIGKFLREKSLDEFPQLFNVLRGEMSLVGPRPLPVDEVKRFNDMAHRRRLSVKPGLTCLWQINGRNKVTDFRDWVRLDLEYIDNWSIWLDIQILLKTIPVVLLGTGAK